MGFISTLALLMPIVFIFSLKLGNYRSFPALAIYYFLVFIYNLFTEGYLHANENVIQYWGLSNNFLDAPVMLTFLSYFSTSVRQTKRLRIITFLLIAFDIAIISWKGFTIDAATIIMAPGLSVVLFYCLLFFIRQTKISILHQKAVGKALMTASLLFAYGCYVLIYLIYYIFKTPDVANTFLIYFFVTTLSSVLLCAGLFIEKKRIIKLEELKQTRRELTTLYSGTETKTTIPMKTVALDFDKEQWN